MVKLVVQVDASRPPKYSTTATPTAHANFLLDTGCPPPPYVNVSVENDLHTMKCILYEIGHLTVAR